MNRLWRSITRDNNLFIGVMQCIKGVKKFFFGRLFSSNKLYIINKQNIYLPVLCTEFFSLLKSNCINNFVCKLFRCYIQYVQPSRFTDMPDSMQQMCFAKANTTIKKERIIDAARILGNCKGSSMG